MEICAAKSESVMHFVSSFDTSYPVSVGWENT